MTKKATDIVSYITIIGWLIAYLAGTKEESKFHLNQALVLAVAEIILGILGRIFPHGILSFIIVILDIVLFVFWIIGLAGAIRGEEKKVPWLGDFQILK